MLSFQEAAEKGYIQSNDFKENLGYACIYSGEFDKGEALLLSIWEKSRAIKTSFGIWLKYSISKTI